MMDRTVLVPNPTGRYVISRGRTPLYTGTGSRDYACGGCSAELVKGVLEHNLRDVIFRCPQCGAYSRIE